MIDNQRLRAYLARWWGLSDPVVQVHNAGMNSATWLVDQQGQRWVAKAVAPGVGRWLDAGLQAAAHLQAAGLPAGAAVATTAGRMTADVDGVRLALLTWVDGDPLTGTGNGEQELIGATLARVHRLLHGLTVDGAQRFHWIDTHADHLSIRAWIRPAVAAAVAAYDQLGPESLTQGLLHADPSPDAFRLDPVTGVCGLIDWGSGLVGPLMYDVASAVMYVGGPPRAAALLQAYLEQGLLPRAELDRALAVMLQLRWAVQADYFARRIAAGDLTGIADAAGNETGLEDARRRLTGPGGAT